MTMIACTINNGFPIVLADILLSSADKPATFSSPTLVDNLMDYLPANRTHYPFGLKQKISVITDYLCFAFSGYEHVAKGFLEDLRVHFNNRPIISVPDIEQFLKHYGVGELKGKLSFVLILIEKVEKGFQATGITGGQWRGQKSGIFDDITVLGSGADDFIQAASRVDGNYTPRPQSARESIATNLSLLGSILARERSQLHTFAHHWGGGFELVFFDGERFARFEDMTFVYCHAKVNESGSMNFPVAFKVTHYHYIDGFLLITDVETTQVSSEDIADSVIYSFHGGDCRPFIVPDIEHRGEIDAARYTADLSFSSRRAVLAYILEGKTHNYFPASFHDQGVDVEYINGTSLKISIKNEFIERMTDIVNSKM